MAALGSQAIADSYEQLLHVDADGGGNSTTLVNVKDGDNGTTFALQLATDHIEVNGKVNIDQDSNANALVIDTEATTSGSAILISVPTQTTSDVVAIQNCNSLTTGSALSVEANGSSNTSA